MYKFWLVSVSNDFMKDEQGKISVSSTVYIYQLDHSLIKKEDIINNHVYLMVKNNIKLCLELLFYWVLVDL